MRELARRTRWAVRPTRSLPGLVLSLAVVLAYAIGRDAPLFEAIEGQTLTWRFQARGPISPGAETVLITIDDRALAAFGRWPISRARLAEAVQALAADGAAVIAFDLLLVGKEGPAKDGALGSADQALVAAIKAAGNVVVPMAFVFDPASANLRDLPDALARAAYPVTHAPADRRVGHDPEPSGLLAPPLPLLAAGVPAHVNVFLDADGSLRFDHPALGYAGAYFPSLPVQAVRLYLGLQPDQVAVRFGEGLQLGPRRVATDRNLRLPLNHYGPAGSFETVSFIDLLEGRLPEGTFRGRIALIGTAALGIADGFATPFSQTLPGIEVFATTIDNLLHGRSLDRSAAIEGLDLLAIALGGLLGALLGLVRRPLLAAAGGLGLLVAWIAIATFALIEANVWLNMTFPAAAILLNTAVVSVRFATGEQRARRAAERHRARLSRYVSPLAAGHVAEGNGGGEGERTQDCAIMFVDMRGFTSTSEDLSPSQTLALVRAFHGRVERAVRDHEGAIDKFIGDGALAVFGAPEARAADALNALSCARALAAEIARWSTEREGQGEPPVRVGIGLHFGPVALGEVGGDTLSQVTVTGDAVNVASRLEALTRSSSATIIASEALVEAARALGDRSILDGFVKLPAQEIRGRSRPVEAWAWPG